MNNIEHLPKPIVSETQSLDDLLTNSSGSDKDYNVFIGHNLGYRTFLVSMPVKEFFDISEIANEQRFDDVRLISQRKLDPNHAGKLSIYILKGLIMSAIEYRKRSNLPYIPKMDEILDSMGRQPYTAIQPIVANIRNIDFEGKNLRGERIVDRIGSTACFKIFLAQNNILWVVDGQHRREALKIVFDFLSMVTKTHLYPRKKFPYFPSDNHVELDREEISAWEAVLEASRSFATVAIEMHLGLDIAQERQLFHDLNNLAKKVDTNLALNFDSSNPINLFTKVCLVEQLNMNISEKEVKDWKDDDGSIALKDIIGINAILFLNKTNISTSTPEDKEKEPLAKQFWVAVNGINGFGEETAKNKTVAAQPVVLKALAKIMFDLSFSKRKPDGAEKYLEIFLENITRLDFSHHNQIWNYYHMDEEQRNQHFPGLTEYLPDATSGNRDIGSVDSNGFMRFGNKHNDIYPIIADMIRWKLNLPNRHKKM